jgi:hypothetical protein
VGRCNAVEVGDCSNPGRDVPQDEDRKQGAEVAAHVENTDDDEGTPEGNNHNGVVVVAVGVSLVYLAAGIVPPNALEC